MNSYDDYPSKGWRMQVSPMGVTTIHKGRNKSPSVVIRPGADGGLTVNLLDGSTETLAVLAEAFGRAVARRNDGYPVKEFDPVDATATATEMRSMGLTVRQVAACLGVSKSQAHRMLK